MNFESLINKNAFDAPVWDDDVVSILSKRGDDITADVLLLVRGKLNFYPPVPDWNEGLYALNNLFGDLASDAHAFNFEHMGWANLKEPHVTLGWAHFLSPDTFGHERAEKLCEIFYQALCKTCGQINSGEIAIDRGTLKVTAEKSVPGGSSGNTRNIDLLIEWSCGGKPDAFVVELKFGHHLTNGQLPAYRKHVKNIVGHSDIADRLFVLASNTNRQDTSILGRRPNKDWKLVFWPDFMRAFEKVYLEETRTEKKRIRPSEDGFAQFRHTIWQKILKD